MAQIQKQHFQGFTDESQGGQKFHRYAWGQSAVQEQLLWAKGFARVGEMVLR